MSSTKNGLTPLSAVNGWVTAFPVPEYEDWDGETAMDPYPFGRLRDIDGRLVYMFDYQYEQYLKNLEREEEKIVKEEGRKVAYLKLNIFTNGRYNATKFSKRCLLHLQCALGINSNTVGEKFIFTYYI